MIRFVEDLGIVPNKDKPFVNDPSLKQGQKMMEYERIYTFFNMNRINRLETGTYPSKKDKVKTIVETMESIESASKSNSAIVPTNNNNTLSINEQKFYKKFTEFLNTSKLLEKEIIEHKDADQTLLCETLGKQYESLIDISTLIEKELDFVQPSSDKKLAVDFAKKKNDLDLHIKKLKKSRGQMCGGKEKEKEKDTIEISDQVKIIALAIGAIFFIYKILE